MAADSIAIRTDPEASQTTLTASTSMQGTNLPLMAGMRMGITIYKMAKAKKKPKPNEILAEIEAVVPWQVL